MKQKLFTLILLLIAGTLSPTLLMADETLNVGDKTVTTTSNQSSIKPTGLTGGTISWNASSKTLTFTDVIFESTNTNAVKFTGKWIILVFKGKNVIKSAYNCFLIDVSNYCDINSENSYNGPTASLELESTASAGSSYYTCIWMKNGVLDINNIYLKATSNYGHAIYGNGSNRIRFQTVWSQIKSVASKYRSITNFASCTVENGSYLKSGKWDESKKTLVDGSSTAMTAVYIDPVLTVGGVIVPTDFGEEISLSPKGKTAGGIYYKYGEEPELSFYNVTGAMGATNLPYPYAVSLVCNNKLENLIIKVKGKNTLTPVSGTKISYGITTSLPITVEGVEYYTKDELNYTGDNGLQCTEKLTVKNVTLNLKGDKPMASLSEGKTFALAVNKSKITSESTSSGGFGMTGVKSCTMTYCDVVDGYYEGGKFLGSADVEAKKVKIVPYKATYPFTILGRQLNDANITGFAAKGWIYGDLSYDYTNRKLTMESVSIDASTSNPDVSGILFHETNNTDTYELHLNGIIKVITGNKPALEMTSRGSLIVSAETGGVQEATFQSYNNVGCDINVKGTDIRTLSLKGEQILFKGSQGGLKGGSSNTALKLLKEKNSKYYFMSINKDGNATNYPAFTVGSFDKDESLEFMYEVQNGVKFSPSYWDADQKKLVKNGGAVPNLVMLRPYTEQYNVWIGGIQLNDINSKGLAANFFTKAGDTQVTYDASKKTLTLNNADIDLKAKSVSENAITVSDDNTIISLNGVNKVKPAGGKSGIFAAGSTTISSATKDFKSTLELVSGLTGMGIDMHYSSGSSSRFVIQDKAVVTLTGLWTPGIGDKTYEGWGRLMVADATIHVDGGITGMAALSMSNCGFSYPVGADFDKEKRMVVDFLGDKAAPVEIFSINDNVTEMIGALSISEENFPDEKFRTYLLEQDYGKDHRLSPVELENVTMIEVPGLGIKDLTGIENFKALVGLDCSDNQLTKLDLSKNTKLVGLLCNTNQLTSLDLSQNTKLEGLYCYINNISGEQMDALIASLPTLSAGTEGKLVPVSNFATESNRCSMKQVEAAKKKGWIVYSYKTNTDEIAEYAGFDPVVATIDATNFPDEKFRAIVASTKINKNGDEYLTDSEAKVSYLDVPEMGIKDLTGIKYFTELEWLDCSNNLLSSLDLSQNTKLTYLNCFLNKINGEQMDALIASLPTTFDGEYGNGTFWVYVYSDGTELNECTKDQVAAAEKKGWTAYTYNNINGATSNYLGRGSGDLNHNGVVNENDLNILVNHIMGKLTGDEKEFVVNGNVVDDANEAVIGASVIVEGTKNTGTVADMNGNFRLQVKEGANLRISYIGYKTVTVKAAPIVKVILQEDNSAAQSKGKSLLIDDDLNNDGLVNAADVVTEVNIINSK